MDGELKVDRPTWGFKDGLSALPDIGSLLNHTT
jgi:hypothetical protein